VLKTVPILLGVEEDWAHSVVLISISKPVEASQ